MTADLIHYLAAADAHVEFADRLFVQLTALGFKIDQNDVLEYVLTDFDSCDFEYGQQLLQCESVPWHLLTLGPAAGSITERNDHISAARSLNDALSNALSEMDTARVFPDEVVVQNSTIEFRLKGALVIKVQPVPFEFYSADARARVEKDLKGVLAYGPDEHACKRLKNVPGLESISGRSGHDSTPNGMMLIKTAANLAWGLRNRLRSLFDVELKLHQTQEIFAACFGAKNWAHLVAKENEPRCWTKPIMLSTTTIQSGLSKRNYRYFRTAGEGIWAFAQTLATWTGEPLGAPRYHGKGLSGGCPYIDAHFARNLPIDPLAWVEDACDIAPMSEVYPDPAYDTVASLVLANPGELADSLSQVLHINDPLLRLIASNDRLGISTDENTRIGEWLFSIRSQGYHKPMLFAEKFNGTGGIVNSQSTVAYKAEIQYDPETELCIVARDYGRTADIVLANFTSGQVTTLVGFCGDHFDSRIGPPRHSRFWDAT